MDIKSKARLFGLATTIVSLCGLSAIVARHDDTEQPSASSFGTGAPISVLAQNSLNALQINLDRNFTSFGETSAQLTLNPAVNSWFNSSVGPALAEIAKETPSRAASKSGPSFNITAVLADRSARIRAIYSNAPSDYFGSSTFPLASTGKIFVGLALGKHDVASERYCVPISVTSWLPIDASLVEECERTVSARVAFGYSMAKPLLWRSYKALSNTELRAVYRRLGLHVPESTKLIEASVMGAIKERPIVMHRAVHAITLGLAGINEPAAMPTLIDDVPNRTYDGEIDKLQLVRPSIPSTLQSGLMDKKVQEYFSEVFFAPIRTGTLSALSAIPFKKYGISSIWAKTGTFARYTSTHYIWIVGGLTIMGAPYSWLVFVSTDEADVLGNTNASSFSPIARLLIESAVRDQKNSIEIPMTISLQLNGRPKPAPASKELR